MLTHTNKQFQAELETTQTLFLEMGALVASMVSDSMGALAHGDSDLIGRVRANEKRVNRFEVHIDERIGRLIALHQPTASDLRFLLAISKMLTDMERCGDEAHKIAKIARRLYQSDAIVPAPSVDFEHMGRAVTDMIRAALDAFTRQDPVAAAAIVRSDKAVNKEWKAMLGTLISSMVADPRTISHGVEWIFIARALERIGDHAKNMGERVIYLVLGDDVRHLGVKNTERMARGEPPQPRD